MIANVLQFSLAPIVLILMAVTLNQKVGKKIRKLIWPVIIYIVLCIQSAYSGMLFFVTSDNHYIRGPYFWVNSIISIYTFAILFYSRKDMDLFCDKHELFYLNIIYLLIILGGFCQLCFPAMHTMWCTAALAILFYYIFVRELELKYDSLTRFKNYRFFIAHLPELSREKNFILVMIEAVRLSEINEHYGFLEGDNYIKDAARAIKDSFRSAEVYRISGGTFCVVASEEKEKTIQNCILHMKLKARKYMRKGIPLEMMTGYESYIQEAEKSKEEKLEAVRHCFYSASAKMSKEKHDCKELLPLS